MPLVVSCHELRPGMRLYEPLVWNGQVLLQDGRTLSPSDITVLQRRFNGLSVRIGDPVLDDAIEFENDSYERYVADKARQMASAPIAQVQKRSIKRLLRGGAGRISLGDAELHALQTSLNELVQFLSDNPTSAALITSCVDSRSYLSTHTGNVCYLSMLLGSKVLEYVATERKRQTLARELGLNVVRDLTGLGLGAMTIDLGLLLLQGLFNSDKPLSEADCRALREHPVVGADMLPESFSTVARMIVRTHHENVDGSGYPEGLDGERLHIFTRIVRIADAYDAATSERVYQDAKSPARVLWEMLAGPYKRFYDPTLTAAFARLIQPFPIGAKLRLEDGRYAAVVKYNRINPFKPTVVIAFDARNKPIPRRELEDPVALSLHPDLRIRSFHGEDLSFLYDAQLEKNAEARESFTTLFEAAFP